jgi:hypothetical protein
LEEVVRKGVHMNVPNLYRGLWPQNVSKLAKYSVRFVDKTWKVTVLYEAEAGLRYLAVEGGGTQVASRVNDIKTTLREEAGGAFYVNEYKHIIVPVAGSPSSGTGSHYYYAGPLATDFSFEFEGRLLTTKPMHPNGTPLAVGERWVGPRPGIPYVLAAGAGDIYYETPALTDDDPPKVRPSMKRKVQLSKVIGNKTLLSRACRTIADLRGHKGGRFYVNEHAAIFTPVDAGDGNGLDYIYCGQIDRSAWFPEPRVKD